MNAPLSSPVDAIRLLPNLYQGSTPHTPAQVNAWAHKLYASRFRTVVFCAQEVQPATELMTGLEVLRAPLDDDFLMLPKADWIRAAAAAERVARRVRAGKKVLVVCAQGRNRSGLVNALALHMLTGMPGAECVEYIRRRRRGALMNPRFVARLTAIR